MKSVLQAGQHKEPEALLRRDVQGTDSNLAKACFFNSHLLRTITTTGLHVYLLCALKAPAT